MYKQARILCKPMRCLRTNAIRFIGSRDHLRVEKQLSSEGLYAITSLIVTFDDPNSKEDQLYSFLKEFSNLSPSYINLKRLSLNVPYMVVKGDIIADIMRLDTFMNELELDAWAFHTPVENQWESENIFLEKLKINMNDGCAFPSSFSDILTGLKCHQSSIKQLIMTNQSPHVININKRLLPAKADYYIENIKLQELYF